jgi:hypothetical protein
LTLIEVSRWTYQPQIALDDLLSTGKIDIDALRTLNSLVELIGELTCDKPVAALDATPLRRVAVQIVDGGAVDEADIEHARQWVLNAGRLLQRTTRKAYQHALNHMVQKAESKMLMARLASEQELNGG